ncbi:DUF2219 family protein [Roseovarius spongiae]|uniref:DUF2219 family protein n=1 Tax=Roseovarius spongiae TaxID=2320272 RepID=A0A3A8B8F6_9RHOB|nr:lipid A-modifier LpxR family protein [Roseovarius spongiae]RKF13878.1 DUF2219 family protein [Roseovarius spongiae]
MIRILALALCAVLTFTGSAATAERVRLGYGRLVTNDLLGDGADRWRSGSVASSRVWGPGWTGGLPSGFGELLELRLGAEAIAPEDLARPGATDRPYAGLLTVGLHTHFDLGGAEMSLGGDLVFTGPQTGIDDFQDFFHDALGGQNLSSATRRAQIGDDIHPTAVLELGRTYTIGQTGRLRPFVEARAGIETLARVGADLTFGPVGRGELLLRDPVSGHRYRAITNHETGFAWVVGGDIAHVESSALLPASRGFALADTRNRLRAGLHWSGQGGHRAFYGLTWLDREFKGQRERQVIGSLRIHVDF